MWRGSEESDSGYVSNHHLKGQRTSLCALLSSWLRITPRYEQTGTGLTICGWEIWAQEVLGSDLQVSRPRAPLLLPRGLIPLEGRGQDESRAAPARQGEVNLSSNIRNQGAAGLAAIWAGGWPGYSGCCPPWSPSVSRPLSFLAPFFSLKEDQL